MKERLLNLMERRDEDIDFSDIPRITDFSTNPFIHIVKIAY